MGEEEIEMAEAADGEEAMTRIREFTTEMGEKAIETLGPSVAALLEGRTDAEKIDVLTRLCCIQAYTGVSAMRLIKKSPEPFEDAVRRVLRSMLGDLLPLPRGEDYKIIMDPGVEAVMAADPVMAEGVTDIIAKIRQAMDGVATGRYANQEEAMEAIGAKHVIFHDDPPFDDDDDGGTLQ